MDRFAELKTFIAVVEAGSFSAAATRLGIAVSAVSRRMDELEDRLGVRLANRSTRGFAPTPVGQDYYQSSLKILADLSDADAQAKGEPGRLSGTIRIAAPVSFGIPYLAPALNELAQEAPELVFDVDLSDRRVDLVSEGFDIAVRIGALADSTLMARKLFDVEHVVAASPDYWKANGKPATPAALVEHRILAYRGGAVGTSWQYRGPDGARGSIAVQPDMICNNGDVLAQSAEAGLGVMVEPSFICASALKGGRLEPVLTDYSFFDMAAYVVYASGRPLPSHVRLLIERLVQRFSGAQPWDAWKQRRGTKRASRR